MPISKRRTTTTVALVLCALTLLTACGDPINLDQEDRDRYAKLAHQRDLCEGSGGKFTYDPNWIPNYTCRFDSE